MHHPFLLTATLLASTGKHLSVGPWIIVPILILAAIIVIPVYVVRDRRKRRAASSEERWPSAMRPWAPQYDGLRRYKVTRDGIQKKRAASARIRG